MNLKEIVAKVIGKLTPLIEDLVKPAVEVELKKQISENSDKQVEKVLEFVKQTIPGGFDDTLIEANKAKVQAMFKAWALAEADKISDKV